MDEFRFVIRGARGGRPSFGPQFGRYGSHTTCFSLETQEGFLVIDAGTAIETLSDKCLEAGPERPIAIFFTHFHLDHLIGLSAFAPLYHKGYDLQLYAATPEPKHPWPDILLNLIDEPYWPVPMRKLPSKITYHDLDTFSQPLHVPGAKISWCELAHTQRCQAYKIGLRQGTITIATDHEAPSAKDDQFLRFCKGSNILIQDAQYTPEEYEQHRGWGHGTWQHATQIAEQAGVQRLILTHHDPNRTDEAIAQIENQTQSVFPHTQAAHERMVLSFEGFNAKTETSLT